MSSLNCSALEGHFWKREIVNLEIQGNEYRSFEAYWAFKMSKFCQSLGKSLLWLHYNNAFGISHWSFQSENHGLKSLHWQFGVDNPWPLKIHQLSTFQIIPRSRFVLNNNNNYYYYMFFNLVTLLDINVDYLFLLLFIEIGLIWFHVLAESLWYFHYFSACHEIFIW